MTLFSATLSRLKLFAPRQFGTYAVLVVLVLTLGISACSKKPVQANVPPPAARGSQAPTVTFTAVPGAIQVGQTASLAWQTEGADTVRIEPLGAVAISGSQSVSPPSSTTYHLVAIGPGGQTDATAQLVVTPATVLAPKPLPIGAVNGAEESMFLQNVQDVFFDYDQAEVRGDQSTGLDADVRFLKQHSNIRFTIEGYCDERGSTEYNLALGASRATAVKEALVRAGISAARMQTTSYGKEKPFCTESTEECWQQNRRGHFVYQK